MVTFCYFGNPLLRKQSVAVTQFNPELRLFIDEMVVAMREKDGVGLAAPQVNRSIRLAVIIGPEENDPPYVLVNPVITWLSSETAESDEGCLSVPEITLAVLRPVSVSVSAQDATGRPFTIEKAEGILSRALQHEIDHLNGIMFVDRVSPVKRQMINGKLKKISKGDF